MTTRRAFSASIAALPRCPSPRKPPHNPRRANSCSPSSRPKNATGVSERFAPVVAYLSKALATEVVLRIAQDYAAVIEGQRSGQVHFAYYGPVAFARALKQGIKTEALVQDVNADGSRGYYAVFYVRADSPYHTLADLAGKNLGLVDPNSASGYDVPLYTLDHMGIDPAKFFAKVIFTGSHENAILALKQGTVDLCVNWYNDEQELNLQRMARKGMVSVADFRIVLKSDLIANAPWAALSDLPASIKSGFKQAMLSMADKDPATFATLTDGQAQPYQAIDNAAYAPLVELITFTDRLRRKR